MKHWRRSEGWVEDLPSARAQLDRESRDAVLNFIRGGAYAFGFVMLLVIVFGLGYALRAPSPVQHANPQALKQTRLICTTMTMNQCIDRKLTSCQKIIKGRLVYASTAC